MPKLLNQVISPFKEFGCFAGAVYITDRLLERISPRLRLYFYELLVQPISKKPLLPARLASTFQIREINRNDPEVAVMPARPDIKQSRFEQRAICLGVFQNAQFIGHIWFSFGSYEEDEVRCTFLLPPGGETVFDFDLYLFPEHRMGLGFAAIWNAANQFLSDRGINFSFSRLTRFNLASRRAHQHLGAKRIGRMFVLQIGAVELMWATVSPYFYLSYTKSKRAQIRLGSDSSCH
jgi:hypothetical protein